jgi:hypothetical protein
MFSGGTWKLHTIYVALEDPPLHATPQDWKRHIGLLKQWVSAKPHSITAGVALAEAYVNYALGMLLAMDMLTPSVKLDRSFSNNGRLREEKLIHERGRIFPPYHPYHPSSLLTIRHSRD